MNPINLKIQGINSFRDQQEIDFVLLSEQGLFGIFGNTGSGKSTILDSMSLALYGVKAIARETNEFITSGCNNAVINFKFSIKGEIYLVERSFKNKKDTNEANSNKAILAKITNTPNIEKIKPKDENIEVIASTNSAVTKACIEITNLTQENFFRTIVLPQGKFSNFLKLEGAERREMLEEIFNLEKYGDILNEKIKIRKKTLEDNLNLINGLAASYKEVSQEVCDKLKEEVDLIHEELAQLNKDKATITEQFDVMQKNWELQQNKVAIEAQLNDLKLQLPAHTQARTKNELATKANLIKEFLDNKNTAIKAYNTTFKLLNTVKAELEQLEEEQKGIPEAYALALANKNTQIPLLSIEQTKLEQALKDEKTLNSLNSSIKKITKKLQGYVTPIENLKQEKLTSENTQKDLSNIITQLQKQIADNTVTTEARDNVEKGLQILKDITQSQKDKTVKESEITTTNDSIIKFKEDLTNFNTKKEELKTANSSTEDSDALSTLENELQQTKKLAHEHEIDNIVSNLKSKCVVGEACPVCGTHLVEMPTFNPDDNTDYDSIITEIESKIELLKTKIHKANTNHAINVSNNENDITNTKKLLKDKEDILTELQGQLAIIQKTLDEQSTKLVELKETTQIDDFDSVSKDIKAKDLAKDKLAPQLVDKQNLHQTEINLQQKLTEDINTLNLEVKELETQIGSETAQVSDISDKLGKEFGKNCNFSENLATTIKQIKTLEDEFTAIEEKKNGFDEKLAAKKMEHVETNAKTEELLKNKDDATSTFNSKLEESPFNNEDEVISNIIEASDLQTQIQKVEEYFKALSEKEGAFKEASKNLGELIVTEEEFVNITNKKESNNNLIVKKSTEQGEKNEQYQTSLLNLKKGKKVFEKQAELEHQIAVITEITHSLKGKKIVEYLATNRLKSICRTASKKLNEITAGEYELKLNNENQFKVKHITQGGAMRSPSTLSGGETFKVSLTLALALSQEIQLKSATSLDLFFLDEGFDTLDEDSLETVISVVEDLTQSTNAGLKIGVISHLASLKARIPVQLKVTGSNSANGSKVKIEYV